ncbi:MAG TPA: hypothetical protein VIV60_06635 [Polyangiaceae bacterium]
MTVIARHSNGSSRWLRTRSIPTFAVTIVHLNRVQFPKPFARVSREVGTAAIRREWQRLDDDERQRAAIAL